MAFTSEVMAIRGSKGLTATRITMEERRWSEFLSEVKKDRFYQR
ncbi:hypothetical protein AB0H34_17375 [Saccharopolyspora shandongensis]